MLILDDGSPITRINAARFRSPVVARCASCRLKQMDVNAEAIAHEKEVNRIMEENIRLYLLRKGLDKPV